jgi:hypothetical protein
MPQRLNGSKSEGPNLRRLLAYVADLTPAVDSGAGTTFVATQPRYAADDFLA